MNSSNNEIFARMIEDWKFIILYLCNEYLPIFEIDSHLKPLSTKMSVIEIMVTLWIKSIFTNENFIVSQSFSHSTIIIENFVSLLETVEFLINENQ